VRQVREGPSRESPRNGAAGALPYEAKLDGGPISPVRSWYTMRIWSRGHRPPRIWFGPE
jgi:hypothetical protein